MRAIRATVCAILATASCAGAMAQTTKPKLDIQPQPLRLALNDLGEQAGLQIVFRVEDVANESFTTPRVSGELSPAEALERMLSASSLRFEFVNPTTVLISKNTPATTDSASNTGPAAEATAPLLLAQNRPRESQETVQESQKSPTVPVTESIAEIIVTGTHVRGGESPSPIIQIDSVSIERSGYQTAGDLIRGLPQSFGGGYSSTVVGVGGTNTPANPSGASSPNIRGLGNESTLTLVNGRRLAFADQANAVDVSLIPLPAVVRVDVLTDGASAIYGSDAVAGVVNFVLRDHYDGIEARAGYGESSRGGAAEYRTGLLAGTSWSTGGGLVSYEYAHEDALLARERTFTAPSVSATSLRPETRRQSLFFSANQTLLPSLSLFSQGLYTKRHSDSTVDITPFGLDGGVSVVDSAVEQYGAVLGANLEISNGWLLSLAGNHAKNSTDAPSRTFLGDALLQTVNQIYGTKLSGVEFTADGKLFELPAGPVSSALGASYRKEEFAVNVSVPGLSISDFDASRLVRSAYIEITAPILAAADSVRPNTLDLTLAGRYDSYSDFGSSVVPKFGLIYRPTTDLQIKASWGESFRAPSLFQSYLPQSANAQRLSDGTVVLIRGGGNPLLDVERSTSTSLNVAYSPTALPGTVFSATYFNIDYTDRIGSPIPDTGSALSNPFVAQFVLRNPSPQQLADILAVSSFSNFTGAAFDPASVAAIIDARFANAQKQRADGVDLLTEYRSQLLSGQLELSLNATYLRSRQVLFAGSPSQDLSGNVFYPPKVRARAGANWSRGGWTVSLYENFTGGFDDPLATPEESVSSLFTTDLNIAYRTQIYGIRRARAALSVSNLFDRDPPFVSGVSSGYPGLHYDSTNASAIGRLVSAQVSVEF